MPKGSWVVPIGFPALRGQTGGIKLLRQPPGAPNTALSPNNNLAGASILTVSAGCQSQKRRLFPFNLPHGA